MPKNFEQYYSKIRNIEDGIPKIFEKVAKKSAIKFVNSAKDRTKKEGLVDTGAYRNNWAAEAEEVLPDTYGVICTNSMEYASHLEYGHKLRNGKRWKGRFVGELSLNEARFFAIEKLDDEFEKLYKKS